MQGQPDGKLAKAGKKVLMRYVGKLKSNGKVFDQTGDIKHYDDVPHIKHWRALASLRSTEAR